MTKRYGFEISSKQKYLHRWLLLYFMKIYTVLKNNITEYDLWIPSCYIVNFFNRREIFSSKVTSNVFDVFKWYDKIIFTLNTFFAKWRYLWRFGILNRRFKVGEIVSMADLLALIWVRWGGVVKGWWIRGIVEFCWLIH